MSSKTEPTPLKAAKNAAGGESTKIETIKINCAGRNYQIQSLILEPGTLLYNRYSKPSAVYYDGHGTNVTLWFGIKEEDVESYGNILGTYIVKKPIRILLLDSKQTDNFECIKLLIPSLVKLIDSNWKSGRHTTREGDFPVVNALSEKLPGLGIDGIGTGRGVGYIDAPLGHHSEVALFPSVWKDEKLEQTKAKKIKEMEAQGPVRKKRKKSNGGASSSKRRRSGDRATKRLLF